MHVYSPPPPVPTARTPLITLFAKVHMIGGRGGGLCKLKTIQPLLFFMKKKPYRRLQRLIFYADLMCL